MRNHAVAENTNIETPYGKILSVRCVEYQLEHTCHNIIYLFVSEADKAERGIVPVSLDAMQCYRLAITA